MGWFDRKPEPEEQEPAPVRLASPEFVSALVEIAEIYEAREKFYRANVLSIADRLSCAEHFNFGDLDRALDDIRSAISKAFTNMAQASEVRGWIQDYEYRGSRPPYMPPLPPEPEKPYRGGE